ncbi:hypothetical protein Tco_0974691 [Tanacetum coccineum]|uniref:Uncharacterized protein n=1 Tax=Tanacetum coccineum TaxID=301880 RepID=A0ABQ5ECA6_9ASTR
MKGFIKDDDDESRSEQMKRWNIYANYDDAYEINHEIEELYEVRESPVCNVRRYMMIKYSFNNDDEFVAIKENEYDDLTITRKEACLAYQEIFQIMDKGWMDIVKEISMKLVECIFSGILVLASTVSGVDGYFVTILTPDVQGFLPSILLLVVIIVTVVIVVVTVILVVVVAIIGVVIVVTIIGVVVVMIIGVVFEGNTYWSRAYLVGLLYSNRFGIGIPPGQGILGGVTSSNISFASPRFSRIGSSSGCGKKCRESNIGDSDNIRDGGKIVGGAIGACGGIVSRLVELIHGSYKGEYHKLGEVGLQVEGFWEGCVAAAKYKKQGGDEAS